jgi:hypothetical protein
MRKTWACAADDAEVIAVSSCHDRRLACGGVLSCKRQKVVFEPALKVSDGAGPFWDHSHPREGCVKGNSPRSACADLSRIMPVVPPMREDDGNRNGLRRCIIQRIGPEMSPIWRVRIVRRLLK